MIALVNRILAIVGLRVVPTLPSPRPEPVTAPEMGERYWVKGFGIVQVLRVDSTSYVDRARVTLTPTPGGPVEFEPFRRTRFVFFRARKMGYAWDYRTFCAKARHLTCEDGYESESDDATESPRVN